MPSPAALSRRYIEADNAQDLHGLVALVADPVDYKRPDDPALASQAEVARNRGAVIDLLGRGRGDHPHDPRTTPGTFWYPM